MADPSASIRSASSWTITRPSERNELVAEWIKIADAQEKLSAAQLAPQKGPHRQQPGGINAASRELGIERKIVQRATKVASLSDEAKEAARETGLHCIERFDIAELPFYSLPAGEAHGEEGEAVPRHFANGGFRRSGAMPLNFLTKLKIEPPEIIGAFKFADVSKDVLVLFLELGCHIAAVGFHDPVFDEDRDMRRYRVSCLAIYPMPAH